MTFKYDVIMFVLIIAKYRLRQEFFEYGTVQNRIIFPMCFYCAVLKIHVARKILDPTTCEQVIIKKISQMWKLRPSTT